MTAPAKLVAAWPDGNEELTSVRRRGSASGKARYGRGRSTMSLPTSERRSALQTAAAVKAAQTSGSRPLRRARSGARAIQRMPP
jgi:hypothetical protein